MGTVHSLAAWLDLATAQLSPRGALARCQLLRAQVICRTRLDSLFHHRALAGWDRGNTSSCGEGGRRAQWQRAGGLASACRPGGQHQGALRLAKLLQLSLSPGSPSPALQAREWQGAHPWPQQVPPIFPEQILFTTMQALSQEGPILRENLKKAIHSGLARVCLSHFEAKSHSAGFHSGPKTTQKERFQRQP